MRRSRCSPLAVLTVSVVVIGTTGSHANGDVIHAPVACAAAERFPRFEARLTTPDPAATVRVLFRVDEGDGWYAVTMTRDGEVWWATLPRPEATLTAFRYRIEARSQGAGEDSPEHLVRVLAAGQECDGLAADTVTSALVAVDTPVGSPVSPPVPRGFSPVGCVHAQAAILDVPESADRRNRKHLYALGGAVVASAGIAAASGHSASAPDGPPQPSGFNFNEYAVLESVPPVGSRVSLSQDRLAITVALDLITTSQPIYVFLRLQDGTGRTCLEEEQQLFGFPANTPTPVTFQAFQDTGGCSPPYAVTHGMLEVRNFSQQAVLLTGASARDPHLPLSYDVVP